VTLLFRRPAMIQRDDYFAAVPMILIPSDFSM
jgi:hypothetical protein